MKPVTLFRFLFLCLLACGCGGEHSAVEPTLKPTPASLPHTELQVKGNVLDVEIATGHALARGLMDRQSMGENKGMLFVFARPQFLEFWMRNTYLPLSIAFLQDDGTIINIEKMQPLDSTTKHWSVRECRLALEVNQGWFEKRGIEAGSRIEIPADVTRKVFKNDTQ